jgi:adenosylcobinamide-phosphate synthase
VVWLGKLIDIFKRFLVKYNTRISGLILTLTLIAMFVFITYLIILCSQINILVFIFVSSLILYTTFAIRALLSTVESVKIVLDDDIEKTRQKVSYLVSRDTSKLSKEELVSAAVESLTENITDSVISPIFYTFIFRVEGAVAYRVINTLDSMVGYKDQENMKIGWFPARLDDVVNFIPARITGFLIVTAAFFSRFDWKAAYHVMRRDAGKTPSPNSGYPMAAAAGALGVQLKKTGYYELGDDINPLNKDTITEALLITKIAIILFILYSTLIFVIFITILRF